MMTSIYKSLLMWIVLALSIPFTAHAINWDYITMTVGDTRRLNVSDATESFLRMVGEANIKSYEWYSDDWACVQVTDYEWWCCDIKALRPCEDVKVTFKCKYRTPGKTYDESMEHCYYIDVKEAIDPTDIDLNYTNISIEVPNTRQLTATVKPAGAPQSVEWKVVSGSSYASVSSSGLVTAKATGTATIRATSTVKSSIFKDCTVTVTYPPTSISLNSSDVSLEVDQTKQLKVTASPDGASNSVKWEVLSGSSYASVDAYGLVRAKDVGSATIRATSKLKSSVYADCSVTVKEATPTDISLSTNENMLVGEKKKLTAKVLPNGSSQVVIWSVVSGESLASVDSYGYVTAEAAGTATVRATSKAKNSVYKDCTINITIPPTEIILPPSATVAVGEKLTLTPEFLPSDAWAEHSWKTDNNTIATVSANGEVTGKTEGITTITATTSNGKTSSCQVWIVPRYQMGEIFTAETEEGVEMKFKVTDTQARTCCVYGDYTEPAIPKSTEGSITIPSRAKGYPVVSVGEHAFKECGNLTSVSIPKGVTTIDESAFEDCSSLTSITLPENVTSIGNYAFYGCNSLTSVIAEMENPATIGKNTFSNRKNATLYVLANSKAAYEAENYWNEFKEIIGYVVPTAITLPSSTIVEIGETITLTPEITPSDALTVLKWTSEDESIATISTSGEVTSIGVGTTTITVTTSNGLSASCELKVIPKYQDGEVFSVQTEEGVEMKFQVTSALTYTCRVYGTSNEAAISQTTEGSITIPSEANGYKVTSIGESAFRSCSGLTSVSIPEGITDIGNSAFLYCSNLTSVTIPNGVTDIGRDAFVYCSSLTSVTIPESVTSIGSSAFRYCDNLVSVTVGMVTPVEIEERTFTNRENAILYVPSGSREAYLTEDYWKDFKEIVVEPTTIKLSESSITINVGESYTLSYTLTPSDATMNLLWTSSDETIATVSSSGVVTGFSKGTTMIRVEVSNGLKDSCLVTVQPTAPTAISLPNNSTFIEVGESITLSPIITPSYAETTLTWTSGDTNIASVTSDGVLEGISEGKTTITVTTSNGLSVSCEVTVVHVFQYDELFTALTEEGVEMKFRITRRNLSQEKTCEVFGGYANQSGYYPAISTTTTGHVTIPNQVNGFIVNAIGNEAFYYCSGLTSVTIPNSVTNIGVRAFRACRGLTSFTIPEGVTHIEDGAFEECSSLTSITLPNNLTSIGAYAFESCSSLTSLIIPNSVTSIGNRAFCSCSHLTYIKVEEGNTKYDSRNNCNAIIETAWNALIVGCKNTIIPDGVTFIDDDAFHGCHGLTSITIPNSVKRIGKYAFYSCSGLTSITIPNSVKSIDYEAFNGCTRLTSISISNSITSIDYAVFAHCTRLTSVTIPESVTEIGLAAFNGCESLTSVTISKSVTSIERSAFHDCNSLTAVAVKMETPAAIDENAFSNSSKATLYVPAGHKAEYEAANYWNDFKEIIEMEDTEPTAISLPEFASVGTGEIKALIPAMTPEYAWAWTSFTWTSEDETIATVSSSGRITGISEGTTTITVTTSNGLSASCQVSVVQPTYIQFADTRVKDRCITYWDTNGDRELSLEEASDITRLETVFESESNITSFNELMYFTGLKEIGNYAFSDCSSLKSINIPEGVTSIGYSAFSGCSSLKSVSIPNNVTSIGNESFKYCSSLTSITIPNSVTSIGKNAFNGCYGLKNVTIGNGVKSIGSSAFCWCYQLTSVTVKMETPVAIDESTFRYGNSATLYVPAGCKAAYEAAEYWKDFKEIIEMTPLTSITLPEFASVGTGETITLTPEFTPSNASTKLTWTSEDETIATVSSSGEVTGISEGTTTITVMTDNGLSASCQVTVVHNYQYGDIFSALTEEGVEMKFMVTNWSGSQEKTCRVYGESSHDEGDIPAIPASTTGHVTIPAQANGYLVTEIGYYAFVGCSGITSVTIPSSVNYIYNTSFSSCNSLASIIVEEGNSRYDSRDNCNAIIETETNTLITGCQNTVIPNNVTNIGYDAFSGCNGLISISIPNSVEEIGYRAFKDCTGLASITIPDGITEIDSHAFDGCVGLMSVFIPCSIQKIGEDVFRGCNSLTSIKVDIENEHYDSRDNCNAIIETETNTLITGCKNTVIPTTVKIIGTGAFGDCTSLVSITIPNSVTTIEEEAFAGCSGLTSVLISNSVTRIDEAAFAESGLTSIIIPKSVTFIDEGTFAGCNSLTSIVVESENDVYDSRDNCNAIIVSAADSLIAGCKNTIIPNTVKVVGDGAFAGYTSLTSISIPNSVTAIDEGAFCYSGLTCMILPSSVTSIGHEAFSMCENLTDVVIGSDMTSIASDAFEDCNSLSNVYCYAMEPPIAAYNYWSDYFSYAFDLSHIEEHTTLHVPEGSMDTYRATAPWSNFKNIVPLTEKDVTDGIVLNEELRMKDEVSAAAVYDLSGRKIINAQSSMVNGKLPRGLNIIRMSDGTTKKVLQK